MIYKDVDEVARVLIKTCAKHAEKCGNDLRTREVAEALSIAISAQVSLALVLLHSRGEVDIDWSAETHGNEKEKAAMLNSIFVALGYMERVKRRGRDDLRYVRKYRQYFPQMVGVPDRHRVILLSNLNSKIRGAIRALDLAPPIAVKKVRRAKRLEGEELIKADNKEIDAISDRFLS